jgi:hypothetical protein
MQAQDLTNEQRSAAEVAAFIADEPGPYFAYWNARGRWSRPGVKPELIRGDIITTWTGDRLADITWTGNVFGSGFGDRRQNFRALGVNGATYSGTAYLTAGDYVRMRPVKP